VPLKENEIREISDEVTADQPCLNCENSTKCLYNLLEESGEIKFLCTFNCVKEHREDNPDKYSFTQKKVKITEIPPAEHPCSKCDKTKSCKYSYRITVSTTVTKDPPAPVEGEELPEEPSAPIIETVQSTETRYICEETCLKELIGDNTEKYVVKEVTRRSGRVREAPKRLQVEELQEVPKIVARSDAEVEAARVDRDVSFIRRCAQCFDVVNFNGKTVQWETFDFCNEKCLGAYQSLIGAACVQCNDVVPVAAIGKLCVRFGADIKQFCTTQCLNDFKKNHQPCALCSKNLKKDFDENEENIVVKRGNNNFCDETCAKRYEDLVNPKKRQPPYLCSVCNIKKSPKIHVLLDGNVHRFCSTPCFSAFKFVNNVVPDQCDMCTKHFERKSNDSHTIYQGTDPKIFCSRECMCFYITKTRSIWQCNWCKVSKYSFDMIQLNHGSKKMCSLNCMSLFEVSTNALTNKRSKCDHCKIQKQPQYHLSMSDASIRNFCTYQCVLGFQSQFSRLKAAGEMPSVIPAGTAKRIMPASQQQLPKQPVISLVQSLSTRRGRQPYNPTRRSGSPIPVPELTVQLERLSDLPARVKVSSMSSLKGSSSWTPISTSSSSVRVENKTQIVTIPPLPKLVGNKSTMCKAITLNKAINCVPQTAEVECQTEDWLEQRVVVPVPIPIYIPQPMYMYNMPTIVPVPIPIPIPVPIFVPTTRNSASGIMKEIKKIQEKMPTDPYEAELLMMAEMVAGDKKREETDSDSDENNDMEYGDGIENNSSFNEDLVQMAFKMASGNDFDDPPVDLENEMTANTISQSSNAYGDDMDPHSLHHHQLLLLQQQRDAAAAMQNRGRKRIQTPPAKPTNNRNSAPNKRIKREMEVMQPEMPREPAEKPDANMCLKYTFGVNAWKQWVATKNADFEKSSIRRKPIKSEILQLTADELNYSLCMFVKEVRKPNGSEYAPDTIYYLVLGELKFEKTFEWKFILQLFQESNNIFTKTAASTTFSPTVITSSLQTVWMKSPRSSPFFTMILVSLRLKKVLRNILFIFCFFPEYIVTRVEEEHLWECKQLGAHSPHVLLSTLMFFNTKHFNLVVS
jgi:zinc finger MYM-type protein 2/3/4